MARPRARGSAIQFLAHIREVDAIAYVLRCFEDPDITHVEGRIDPIADAEIIETELMLADLESLERRAAALEKRAKGGEKEARETLGLMNRVLEVLREGKPARTTDVAADERRAFRGLNLLTSKPVLYVCNVDEAASAEGNQYSELVTALAEAEGAGVILICAEIEAELAQLEEAEQREYLETLGLEEPGLNRLIRAGYELLDLITFFTSGPNESRAWTVRRDTKAPRAAGTIHTDFERGFIRAETIAVGDFLTLGGEARAKEAGKMRAEGRDYTVKDGDVILFRFNV